MSQVQSVDFQQFTNVTIIAANETIIATGQATSVESPTVKAVIKTNFVLSTGTAAFSITISFYRGTSIIPANKVYSQSESGDFAVAQSTSFSAAASDVLVNAGQAQYCVTVIQNAATTNGTVSAACIETMVLSG